MYVLMFCMLQVDRDELTHKLILLAISCSINRIFNILGLRPSAPFDEITLLTRKKNHMSSENPFQYTLQTKLYSSFDIIYIYALYVICYQVTFLDSLGLR